MAKAYEETAVNIVTKLTVQLLRFYQLIISPLLGPRCRFYPSCSNYSISAMEKYGLLKGAYLTLKRLSKCHPGHEGGLDELDEEFNR